ncbi:hypothetical protein Ccrd_010221 [Cynara cardunculus var. scolymus]|uniref:Uncharacterized protein n=1 Tax=Cynara cardunculus var. scolymus TaxID=59895 RepID=A0A103YLN9_CYNCS|nr:hypothetical protein Ccrd_010221 [Cynara cardunculus var. scolymus]
MLSKPISFLHIYIHRSVSIPHFLAEMGEQRYITSSFLALVLLLFLSINGEDPYRFFTWNVSYGVIYPLGVKQQIHGLLPSIFSNPQFPKPLFTNKN